MTARRTVGLGLPDTCRNRRLAGGPEVRVPWKVGLGLPGTHPIPRATGQSCPTLAEMKEEETEASSTSKTRSTPTPRRL